MTPLLEANTESTSGTSRRATRSAILARQIHDRLRKAGYLALRDVACEVRDDVAFLDGRLRSHYLKQVAQAAAMGVDGIVRSENRIEVVPVRGDTGRQGLSGPVRST